MNNEQQQTAEDQEQPTDARCPMPTGLNMKLPPRPFWPFGFAFVLPTSGTIPLFRGNAWVMGGNAWVMRGNAWVMRGIAWVMRG
jgi:hypothetical protein